MVVRAKTEPFVGVLGLEEGRTLVVWAITEPFVGVLELEEGRALVVWARRTENFVGVLGLVAWIPNPSPGRLRRELIPTREDR